MQQLEVPPSRPPAPVRPLRLPLVGATYPEVLRTPRHRWWRPVVAWPVAILLGAIALFAPMIGSMVVLLARGDESVLREWETVAMTVPMTFVLNLGLALLIGVALLAILIAHPVRAGFLHSVEGRVRWGWLVRCVLVLLPLWAVYVGVSWVVDGRPSEGLPEEWPAYLAMVLFMTPFQAAGEEYLFRGFVLVTIGSWFSRPVVGLVVSCLVSSALFAAAHGSPDPWIVADLVGMSIACCYVTWRTGGLEAAVALHLVNNVVVGVVGTLTGTAADSYIDASTQGTPESTAVSLLVSALGAALVTWLASRAAVARTVPAEVGARP